MSIVDICVESNIGLERRFKRDFFGQSEELAHHFVKLTEL